MTSKIFTISSKLLTLAFILCSALYAYSNNAYYMTLSDQVIRKQDMQIISNNAANANTIGYEQDQAILNSVNYKESKKKVNSFVYADRMFKSSNQGPLKTTGRALDVAIIGQNQYFKLLTPNGVRYTLAGNMIKNIDGVLVNSLGYPYLSFDNGLLELPAENTVIQIAADGTIYSDGEEQNRIGVAYFENRDTLLKEGDSLYRATEAEIPIDEYTIQSGVLRASNVNASRVLTETIDAQRAFTTTSTLLKEIDEIEKQGVSRVLKTN